MEIYVHKKNQQQQQPWISYFWINGIIMMAGAQQNPISFVFQICLVILLQFLRNNIMWLCFAGCVYSKRDVLDLISNLRSRTGYTNITGQHNLTSAIYLQGQ